MRGPALLALLLGACSPAPPAPPVAPGPTLEVVDLAQLGERLGADSAPPTLVNFWATWCPPCVAELPDLAAVAERFAPQGLRVLAVSVDGTAPGEVPGPDEVLAYAEDRGLALPILYFDGDPVELDERYDLPGPYPSTLVLGAGGRPLEVHAGTATRDQFEELARLALQGAE